MLREVGSVAIGIITCVVREAACCYEGGIGRIVWYSNRPLWIRWVTRWVLWLSEDEPLSEGCAAIRGVGLAFKHNVCTKCVG